MATTVVTAVTATSISVRLYVTLTVTLLSSELMWIGNFCTIQTVLEFKEILNKIFIIGGEGFHFIGIIVNKCGFFQAPIYVFSRKPHNDLIHPRYIAEILQR